MALSKYKLGELIELTTEINSDNYFGINDVMGITITKEFIPTKADVSNTDLRKFLVIHPNEFVFNPRTHGKHIGFGYNSSDKNFIVSWNNIGFRVKEEMKRHVSAWYLFLNFNRSEWDREACFQSWGSSTEVFSWDALCDMEIELPDLATQQKYVDVYLSMLENQKAYERGLNDLKLVCDAYIEDLRRKMPCKEIGVFLKETRQKNDNGLALKNRAVSNSKIFVDAKEAVFSGVETQNYLIVNKEEFAYNTVTTRNADKLSIALNEEGVCLVSPLYTTFKIIDKQQLLPEYLVLWFLRGEYDREARYKSWGSARELFSFDILAETKIPIPSIEVQKSIAELYKVYNRRKAINEKLKAQIKNLCPILLRGAINS